MMLATRVPHLSQRWCVITKKPGFALSILKKCPRILHVLLQPHIRILCSSFYTSCTSRNLRTSNTDSQSCYFLVEVPKHPSTAIVSLRVNSLRDKTISYPKRQDLSVMLPTDMNSRVLDLIQTEPCPVNTSLTINGHELYHRINDSHSSHALERQIFSVLQCTGTPWQEPFLPKDGRLEKMHCSKAKKDVEPADDPNQKIRKLELKLRKQLPMCFNNGSAWHDFSMYTPGVELIITPRKFTRRLAFRGIQSYKRVAVAFRFLCRWCLRDPKLEVLSLICNEDKKSMEIRWRVAGTPFYLQIISFILPISKNRLKKYYDYMSILEANDNAKIWRHDVSKLRPSPSPLVRELAGMRNNIQAAAMTPIVRKTR